MNKNINIRNIPEHIFYEAKQLKAKLKCKNWVAFLEEVIRIIKENEK